MYFACFLLVLLSFLMDVMTVSTEVTLHYDEYNPYYDTRLGTQALLLGTS